MLSRALACALFAAAAFAPSASYANDCHHVLWASVLEYCGDTGNCDGVVSICENAGACTGVVNVCDPIIARS